ncbi:MAG: hypothetical protein ACYC8S_03010 [Minisyncoccota bacterium]
MFEKAPKMGDPDKDDGHIVAKKAIEDPDSGITLTPDEAREERERKLNNEGWHEQK